MKEKRERKDNRLTLPDSKNYTIFHALLETMMKKKEMDSRRYRFTSNTGMLTSVAALLLVASSMIILAWSIFAC